MSTPCISAANAVSSAINSRGIPVTYYPKGMEIFGVEGLVDPSNVQAQLIAKSVKLLAGKRLRLSFVEAITNALHGGQSAGPEKISQTFSMAALGLTFSPTNHDRFIDPEGKSWAVMQPKAEYVVDVIVRYVFTAEEIWPTPAMLA